jgi:Uri superfamily endonuclease
MNHLTDDDREFLARTIMETEQRLSTKIDRNSRAIEDLTASDLKHDNRLMVLEANVLRRSSLAAGKVGSVAGGTVTLIALIIHQLIERLM